MSTSIEFVNHLIVFDNNTIQFPAVVIIGGAPGSIISANIISSDIISSNIIG